MSERADCTHGITLEGVVETCAECKTVLVRRPTHERVLRVIVQEMADITSGCCYVSEKDWQGAPGGYEDCVHKRARDTLASLSPPSTNEEGDRE
jgi:hypothetical protein